VKAGLGLTILLTHITKFAIFVFVLTIPDAIILKPDVMHDDGVKGVPPFTETEQVTVDRVYVFGKVTVAVSVGTIAIEL
jgi:hypothetical protein